MCVAAQRSRGRKPHLIWSFLPPSTYIIASPSKFRIQINPNLAPLPPRRAGHVRVGRTSRCRQPGHATWQRVPHFAANPARARLARGRPSRPGSPPPRPGASSSSAAARRRFAASPFHRRRHPLSIAGWAAPRRPTPVSVRRAPAASPPSSSHGSAARRRLHQLRRARAGDPRRTRCYNTGPDPDPDRVDFFPRNPNYMPLFIVS